MATLTDDLIQWPGVTVSDDQDVSAAISLEDGSDLTGATLLATVRGPDPDWLTRAWTESELRNFPNDREEDPSTWPVVFTSSAQTGSPPNAVTLPRASMALLTPGRFKYVIEISRTDSGNVSPVVPPTWLSVRSGVSRS